MLLHYKKNVIFWWQTWHYLQLKKKKDWYFIMICTNPLMPRCMLLVRLIVNDYISLCLAISQFELKFYSMPPPTPQNNNNNNNHTKVRSLVCGLSVVLHFVQQEGLTSKHSCHCLQLLCFSRLSKWGAVEVQVANTRTHSNYFSPGPTINYRPARARASHSRELQSSASQHVR